jgi:hypothetical protein
MEAATNMTAPSINASSVGFYIALAIFIALIVFGVVYMVIANRNTVPSGEVWKEGFQGPSRGVSDIPCGQESSEAVALAEMFSQHESTTEEGATDLAELKLILSKLCCIKHDLMAPGQVVQSTLTLPYQNSHDRENPADTVARCFSKSLPPRDLDISFGTWKTRGLELLNKLCTSYKFSSGDADQSEKYFMAVWTDVYSVAKTVCVPPKDNPSNSPRDLNGFTPESLQDLGPYKGYY